MFTDSDENLRACPRCGCVKNVTEDFYKRPNGQPRSACKQCEKEDVTLARRARRAGVPPKRAVCSVCLVPGKVGEWHEGDPICIWCHRVLERAGWDLIVALDGLRQVHGHIKEVEERIERMKHVDRGVFPHPAGRFGTDYPAYRHQDCFIVERSLRAAVKYLGKRAAARQSSDPSIHQAPVGKPAD